MKLTHVHFIVLLFSSYSYAGIIPSTDTQEGKKIERGRGAVAVEGHLWKKVLLLSGTVPNSS